jgi:hypothetical protein
MTTASAPSTDRDYRSPPCGRQPRAASSAVVRGEPRERDELVPRTDVSATVEAQHGEPDRERALLGILGPSRDAGLTDSRFDPGDLLRVVAGEQRAQLPDLLALAHGTSLRLSGSPA